MSVLAATEIVDMGTALFGGGPQIAVLFASALQTVWLSVATTLRLARLRVERDTARAAQAELRELAERDPLTGLLNRRGFVDRTEAIIGNAVHGKAGFGLLLIDVDHFKAINDRFGHDAGDRVLTCLADMLAELTGPCVDAARLGGEEFALGVTGLKLPALVEFAEAVRQSVSGLSLADLVGEDQRLSVSIGVAEAVGRSSFRSIYRLADQALYAAKNGGRNRVACAHLGRMDQADRRMKAA
jgi:diguanylate cyclase (GGDEF)-like protein